jgi:hypothetical protein
LLTTYAPKGLYCGYGAVRVTWSASE